MQRGSIHSRAHAVLPHARATTNIKTANIVPKCRLRIICHPPLPISVCERIFMPTERSFNGPRGRQQIACAIVILRRGEESVLVLGRRFFAAVQDDLVTFTNLFLNSPYPRGHIHQFDIVDKDLGQMIGRHRYQMKGDSGRQSAIRNKVYVCGRSQPWWKSKIVCHSCCVGCK